MDIFDITHDLDDELAVWPGDEPYQLQETMTMRQGYSCNVSSVKMSLHSGTHADAHYHYDEAGKDMSRHRLEAYLGPCQVIDVRHVKEERITADHVRGLIVEKRVLFKTGSAPSRSQWPKAFKGLDPSLIAHLAKEEVLLVGTDAPSVDLFDDSELITHQALLKHDLYNLESLNLSGVEAGYYELVALPLKIRRGDASPVRAILIRR